ncbi:cyclin-D5-3-like [Typha angustifolia]|uniref:cyclin-D5-3-like n=1 Tax=Typha angustifolia TaxID=59011 RepID=UPI003C2E848B
MTDTHYSFPLPNLICEEDEGHLYEEEVDDIGMIEVCNSDDEFVELLVSKESSFESKTHHLSLDSWLVSSRKDAVRWILQAKGYFGFGLKTAYMAAAYLDRFLAHRVIDRKNAWAIQLLSIACLSLAAKMEEWKAPALSEFPLEEYEFTNEAIQRMELLVLNTLDWRMSLVTPFAYLGYLASKFQEHGSKELIRKAMEFISVAIGVMNLVDFRPSIIAVAAILAASSEKLMQNLVESKISVISLCEPLDTEHVLSCYTLMIQEANKKKFKPSMYLASPSLSAAGYATINSSSAANNEPLTQGLEVEEKVAMAGGLVELA